MPKCEIISIANQKGGVGKTTTTFNLGVALRKHGKRVLLVDADPQGDLTTSMGWHNPDDIPNTLATLMNEAIDDVPLHYKETILHHPEGIDIIPSNLELSSLEIGLVNVMSRENTMRNVLNGLKEKYDYILIDCMPSLGMITINALATSDKVIIPVESQFLAAKGMNHLLSTVLKVRRQINPDLNVGGILVTMVDNRTNLSKRMINDLKNEHGTVFKLFNSIIPKATRVAEASSEGKSIFAYDKTSKAAISYDNFAREVLDNEREQIKNKSNILSR